MLWERADQTNAFLYDYRIPVRSAAAKSQGEETNAPPVPRKRRVWTKASVQDVKAGIARGLFYLRDGDFRAASIELKRSAEEVQSLPEGWVPLRTQIYVALALALKHSGSAEEALIWWGKARESERGLMATVGTRRCVVWSDALLGSVLFKEGRSVFEVSSVDTKN